MPVLLLGQVEAGGEDMLGIERRSEANEKLTKINTSKGEIKKKESESGAKRLESESGARQTCRKRQCSSISSRVSLSPTGLLDHQAHSVSVGLHSEFKFIAV